MGDMENSAAQVMLNKGFKPPQQEGSKAPQYMFTIAVTMCAFCAGSALAWTSPAFKFIVLDPANNTSPINATVAPITTTAVPNTTTDTSDMFTITKDQSSWVGSLLPVGALFGALPAGYISNIFGRKIVCCSLALPYVVSWLIITYASTAWQLYLARLIVGVAIGASSAVAPMYVGEIAESSVRGTLGSFFQLMMTVGILYTYTLGAFVSYMSLAIFCGVIPILFLLMFFNAPETPVYLLSKGHRREAEAALKRLRGPSYDVSYELNELQRELEKSEGNKASFSDIFTRKAALRGLIVSLGLMVFQQLSGVNAVIFYTSDIFKDAGSTLDPSHSTIIIGVIQVIATYASTLLVDKAGRKILLLISDAVMAVCLGVLGLYFYLQRSGHNVEGLGLLPLGSLALFIIIFSLGFGPIPWMMTGELFASDIKGPATGMAVGLNWFLAFVVTKAFDPLVVLVGSAATFGIFGVICVVGVFFVFLIVPETKGKSLDEVQQILGGSTR